MSQTIEITPENARDYLLARGLIPAGVQAVVEPLGWGISNVVMKVSLPDDCFVFKQSLPKLRVKDDWPFDRARIFVERDCMALLGDLLSPGSVPCVRFSDDENFIFGLSCAPPGGVLWKQALLDGQIELTTARRAGALLADLHNRAAAHPRAQARFASQSGFIQGRVDPYHWTAAKAHPDLAPLIEAEVRRMLETRLTLVHGDHSPKNIFVYSDHVLILDFEVAHYGDPAFDTGFCFNHLILKAVKFPERSERYLTAGHTFWRAYLERLPPDLDPQIEATTIRELGCLLLARIDGKSKIEYSTDEPAGCFADSHGDGGRFGQRADGQRQALRQRQRQFGRGADVFRVGTRQVSADQPARNAQVIQAARAEMARAAEYHRVDGDGLAARQRRVARLRLRAQRGDLAAEFVPHDQRRHAQRVVAEVAAQLRSADAGERHPDQNPGRPGRGFGLIAQRHHARRFPDECFHGRSLSTTEASAVATISGLTSPAPLISKPISASSFFDSRTVELAFTAYPSAPILSAYSCVTGAPPTITFNLS